MSKATASSRLEAVRSKLRDRVLAMEDGALVGSEESIVAQLGVSRSTVRQAARLLEGEGLLRVKRGINGGYYGSRPDEKTIEAAVSAYLATLDLKHEDASAVAAVLWVEVIRRAASLKTPASRKLAETFRKKVLALDVGAPYSTLVALEVGIREAIFQLVKSPYMQMIFHINATFSRQRFGLPPNDLPRPQFARAWRDAKLMELAAIAQGDVQLAIMAGQYLPKIWEPQIASHRAPAKRSERVADPTSKEPR